MTPDGTNIFSDDNQYFFGSVLWSVMAKAESGMYVSFFSLSDFVTTFRAATRVLQILGRE